jgi:prefoldin subunit 5
MTSISGDNPAATGGTWTDENLNKPLDWDGQAIPDLPDVPPDLSAAITHRKGKSVVHPIDVPAASAASFLPVPVVPRKTPPVPPIPTRPTRHSILAPILSDIEKDKAQEIAMKTPARSPSVTSRADDLTRQLSDSENDQIVKTVIARINTQLGGEGNSVRNTFTRLMQIQTQEIKDWVESRSEARSQLEDHSTVLEELRAQIEQLTSTVNMLADKMHTRSEHENKLFERAMDVLAEVPSDKVTPEIEGRMAEIEARRRELTETSRALKAEAEKVRPSGQQSNSTQSQSRLPAVGTDGKKPRKPAKMRY